MPKQVSQQNIANTIEQMSDMLSGSLMTDDSRISASETSTHMRMQDSFLEESTQGRDRPATLKAFKNRIENGYFYLLKTVGELAENPLNAISADTVTEVSRLISRAPLLEKNQKEYTSLLSQGKTFQDIYGISQQTIETLTKAATQIFTSHFYKEASDAFCVLTFLSPKHPDLWIGLGHAEYMCTHYEAALLAYALATNLNPQDPAAHFFAARCHKAIHEKEEAMASIENALSLIKNTPSHKELKKKVLDMKNSLSDPKGKRKSAKNS